MWFLKSPKFETCCNGKTSDEGFNPVLACYRIPGAGKSVMSTLVIDILSVLPFIDGNRIAVAYVYCDYRDNVQQTAVNMVGALLKQVIDAHSDHLPAGTVDFLKQRRRKDKGRLSLEESYHFLESTLQSFSRFYISVDALDECLDEQRKDFLHSIVSLLKRFEHVARIFTTGRPHMKEPIKKTFSFTMTPGK
ncbi:hypothetical protein FPQ18DRAFT_122168 [Pyronema domesticum]|nr:hypothetical protein FPQ18DRAFT_122168 [Pyronema domesticum]